MATKLLAAVLLPKTMRREDPCIVRLLDVMVPTCRADPCSSQCCLSLTIPPNTQCSARWLGALEAQANFFRRKIARVCGTSKCKSRSKCPFSAQFSDSPCTAPECLTYYSTGELNSACKSFVFSYCTKYGANDADGLFSDSKTCDLFVTRGVSTASTTMDVVSDCQPFYDALPTLRAPMQTPVLCLDWVQRTCTTGNATCPCFISSINLWNPNVTFITPCIFNYWELEVTQELDRQFATAAYFFITVLFLVIWKLVKKV